MLGWLFAPRDPVIRLGRGAGRRAFVAALGQADLVVLSLPLAEGLDPASMQASRTIPSRRTARLQRTLPYESRTQSWTACGE